MNIFLSSTCYDLVDLRAELEHHLASKGFTMLLSNRPDFPISIGVHRHQACVDTVRDHCDLFILVLDKRFGAEYYCDKKISVTMAEFNQARNSGKKIFVLVRQNVFDERLSFNANHSADKPYKPVHTDDIRTFQIMDDVQSMTGYWMQPFSDSIEAKKKIDSIEETKHSVLNDIEERGDNEIVGTTIELGQFSGATSSFLQHELHIEPDASIGTNVLHTAIFRIPDSPEPLYIDPNELYTSSNDYSFLMPGANPSSFFRAPSALGKAVRNELTEYYEKLKKNEHNS
jgi:hypothetical protein